MKLRNQTRLIGCVLAVTFVATSARADTEVCASSYERAQELRRGASLLEARQMLTSCIQACPTVLSKDCASWLDDVQAGIASLRIEVRDDQGGSIPDAQVFVDDQPVPRDQMVDVNPGAHQVRARRADGSTGTTSVAVQEREKNRSVLVVIRATRTAPTTKATVSAAPESPTPTIVYVLAGVGLAAIGTGGYLGLSARSEAQHLRDTCKPNCSDSDVDAVSRRLLIGDLFLGAGAVSIGIATWVWLSHGSSSASTSGFDVKPTRQGVALSYSGVF